MGIYTPPLIPKIKNIKLVEIDTESVTYLNKKYLNCKKTPLTRIFLKWTSLKPLMVGLALLKLLTTFQANLFKALEYHQYLLVACSKKKEKDLWKTWNQSHGILSVSVKPITIPNTISTFQCFFSSSS